jgi:flagellar biosynthesis protein FlhB
MYVVKVLKRKDAASIAVAVAIAWIFVMWAPIMVGELSGMLSGVSDNQYMYSAPGSDWKVTYLQPTILAILQFILLEVVLRIIIAFRNVLVRKSK